MAFFSIPGNIKQRFLPFVLNPKASINNFNDDADTFNKSTAENASPQLFTYKHDIASAGGTAYLGFYPMTSFPNGNIDSWNNANLSYLDKDISFKLLYESDDESTQSLTVDDLMSNIPAVSIREFLPDTRLDQCINVFKNLFSTVSKMFMSAKDIAKFENDVNGSQVQFSDLMKKIAECAEFTMDYMTGNGKEDFSKDVLNDNILKDVKLMRSKSSVLKSPDDDVVRYVHNFPYFLYYRLQSCTTTNIYEVPAMCDGKPIMSSDGKPGWGDGSDFMGAGGYNISGLLNNIPGVGTLANMILGNIYVDYMPWWNAATGSRASAPDVTVKFDLFNDNVVKAVKNFIFVNTIVPSNKWIQYNMFQHSSNLYDVKIDGVNRLFACAASFEVTYEGVLRNPSKSFFKLLKKHVNAGLLEVDNFIQQVVSNNLIKIPDVYRVSMTFKTLLPPNFNNFLYIYSQNIKHMVAYKSNVRDSGIGEAFGEAANKFAEHLKDTLEYGAKGAKLISSYSTEKEKNEARAFFGRTGQE